MIIARLFLRLPTIQYKRSSGIKVRKFTVVNGKLYDLMGMEQREVLFSNNKATVNLNGLNKGIYVLKIFYNDKIESHQIAVN